MSLETLNRIKEVLNTDDIQVVADEFCTTTANVYNWTKKNRKVPHIQLIEFSQKTGVSLDWLLFGTEPKYKELYKLSALHHTHTADCKLKHIPYYKSFHASAGFGAFNGDVEEPEYITMPSTFLSSASNHTEAIRCSGDSMSPSINDGDIMFIDRNDEEIRDGEVYVVRCNEELYVKRLFKTPTHIIAKSDNTIYPEFKLQDKEFQVLGKVIYRMEKM